MQAVLVKEHGGPGVLQVEQRTEPSLDPGHLVVDIAAAGVNFMD